MTLSPLFFFECRMRKKIPRPISAKPPIPPTTPPTIAPVWFPEDFSDPVVIEVGCTAPVPVEDVDEVSEMVPIESESVVDVFEDPEVKVLLDVDVRPVVVTALPSIGA